MSFGVYTNPTLLSAVNSQLNMHIVQYTAAFLFSTLVCLCRAKHEQLEIYHTHKGTELPEEAEGWTKVIEEWPDNPHIGRGMDELNQKAMKEVLHKLGEMLHQLAYDRRRLATTYIRTLKLTNKFRYALASTKCVEGVLHQCGNGYVVTYGITLVVPCFSFVVHNTDNPYKFECSYLIYPYHNSRYNITFNSLLPKPPVCHTNSISIDGSRPFCGARGGLVTTSTSPMIKIAMTEYEVFNPNGSYYSMNEISIHVMIQTYNLNTPTLQQLFVSNTLVEGPFIDVISSGKGHTNTIMLYSYRTESHMRGCLKLTLNCRTYPSLFVSIILYNGAVEFRKYQHSMISERVENCSTPVRKFCGDVGDILAEIDIKMEQGKEPLFGVEFRSEDMRCIKRPNVYCKIPDIKIVNTIGSSISLDSTFYDRPVMFYIEKRIQISAELYKYFVLKFWLGSGSYLPVRGCGAGGLYVISDNKDEWSFGPYCGGYATNTLSFLNRQAYVNFGKSVTIIMKGYVRQFGMTINIGISLSADCKGYVNPTVPSNIDVQAFSKIISYQPEKLQQFVESFVKDMEPVIFTDFTQSSCTRIMIMESDDPYLPSSIIPIIQTEKKQIIYTALLERYSLPERRDLLPPYVTPPKELHNHLLRQYAIFMLDRRVITQFQSDEGVILHFNTDFFIPQLGEALRFSGDIPPKREMCEFLTRTYGNDYGRLMAYNVWSPFINPCAVFTNGQVETFTFLSGTHLEYYKFPGCCQLHIYVNQSSGCSGQTVITYNRFYIIKRPLHEVNAVARRTPTYSLGMLRADYNVHGTGSIVLPDYQDTHIILPKLYIHKCSVTVSFLYQPHTFNLTIPSYAVKYNKTQVCIKQVCYNISIVEDMTWTQASEACQSTGGHLPSFKDVRDISLLIYSGLSSVVLHTEVNKSLDELPIWKIQTEDVHGIPEKSYRILHTGAALLGAEIIYTSLSRMNKVYNINK